ncbi:MULTISPECIES: ribose 5-phosphate isomerase B [Thermoactinomyces]|jgi:ribose 5-phosphate isomerase B|uniref:Ribose 5-phosphate isomerase B n=1 Tax=Thermoactinomyces daqus TaxID=1329516 RepID=A0A7W1X848_9BACL|nr:MULTISPECIES: ribose 5-phosphate isomerase B [Thermoactinomyces]MBA4541847.1 ribose 5-phosphate isomerase B [Thermoactinomyces daqus]MBH8597844.1 ribose 5-phosphate isomerase B [Thermoactinomyces sp. CICC 10523]MBH8604196.1 ribose 5-phosphate isomerase B [Thermoactinomyces sp. CICC 10522]
MRIILGSDHGGLRLKKEVKELLTELDIAYEDVGCDCEESVDYPDYAYPVAKKVAEGEFDLGILICGTGIGMSIAANKVKGIRCAVVTDEFSARMAREHNNANILALGERVVGPDLAKSIVRAWLGAEFQGNRHARRLEKISQLEGSLS